MVIQLLIYSIFALRSNVRNLTYGLCDISYSLGAGRKGYNILRTIRLTKTPTGWKSAIQSDHGIVAVEGLFNSEDEAFRETGEFLKLSAVR